MKFDRNKRGRRSAADVFFGESERGRGRHGRGRDDAKAEHHTAALCKQVQRALTFVLAGEVADPLIQQLMVMDVAPAPNAGRLAVMLAAPQPVALADILARLESLRGFLRTRVTESITRKRAPELAFVVVPFGVSNNPGGAP